MVTWLAPLARARAAALEAKKGIPTATGIWYVCPHCGAHQSPEACPLGLCLLCGRDILLPVPMPGPAEPKGE